VKAFRVFAYLSTNIPNTATHAWNSLTYMSRLREC
jgi:hypothetical protein